MDLKAPPRADSYRFANGGWLDRTAIPNDKAGSGVFDDLNDSTTKPLLDLLDKAAAAGNLKAGSDPERAVQLYKQGNDRKTRDGPGR